MKPSKLSFRLLLMGIASVFAIYAIQFIQIMYGSLNMTPTSRHLDETLRILLKENSTIGLAGASMRISEGKAAGCDFWTLESLRGVDCNLLIVSSPTAPLPIGEIKPVVDVLINPCSSNAAWQPSAKEYFYCKKTLPRKFKLVVNSIAYESVLLTNGASQNQVLESKQYQFQGGYQ